jgi:hypothetical protein
LLQRWRRDNDACDPHRDGGGHLISAQYHLNSIEQGRALF